MIRPSRYHPLFESDVINAAEWYDKKLSGLGTDFLARVQDAVQQLMGELELLVFGVMHTSQESQKWLARRV